MNGLVLLPLVVPGLIWGAIGMFTSEQNKTDIQKLQHTEHHQQAEITTLQAELAKLGVKAK